jgi:hypothetical protein
LIHRYEVLIPITKSLIHSDDDDDDDDDDVILAVQCGLSSLKGQGKHEWFHAG